MFGKVLKRYVGRTRFKNYAFNNLLFTIWKWHIRNTGSFNNEFWRSPDHYVNDNDVDNLWGQCAAKKSIDFTNHASWSAEHFCIRKIDVCRHSCMDALPNIKSVRNCLKFDVVRLVWIDPKGTPRGGKYLVYVL